MEFSIANLIFPPFPDNRPNTNSPPRRVLCPKAPHILYFKRFNIQFIQTEQSDSIAEIKTQHKSRNKVRTYLKITDIRSIVSGLQFDFRPLRFIRMSIFICSEIGVYIGGEEQEFFPVMYFAGCNFVRFKLLEILMGFSVN